jgi:protein SCO1/2
MSWDLPGRRSGLRMAGAATVAGLLSAGAGAQDPSGADPHAAHRAAAQAAPDRRAPRLLTPQPRFDEVVLVDRRHGSTTLREVLDTEGPVLVNFVFTTCTTVCPIMTRGFAQLQDALGPDRERVRLVSISIDPEVDTVEALQQYAARHGAGPGWWLLTGTRESSVAAQRSFGAYRGDKMNHAPATFVRAARGAPWQVIDGLASGESLVEVVRAHGSATAH